MTICCAVYKKQGQTSASHCSIGFTSLDIRHKISAIPNTAPCATPFIAMAEPNAKKRKLTCDWLLQCLHDCGVSDDVRKAVAKLLARTPEDVLRTQSATDLFSFLEDTELDQNCGLTVPRLAMVYLQGKFEALLQKFIRSMAGRNFAGQELSPKDAHTMVVLRGSLELLDDHEETEGGGSDRAAGDALGWVSSRVETEMCAPKHGIIQRLIRDVPRATSYVFEAMVLTQAVAKGGLKLKLSDGSNLCLQFGGTCELYGAKTTRDGVLYRPRGDNYPSTDACGIPNGEEAKKFYFIQIATGREHTRIQKRHLERVPVPKDCTIVPTTCKSLTLQDGQNALKHDARKSGKSVCEQVASAESILDGLADDVKQKFEPGRH